MTVHIDKAGRRWSADDAIGHDLSIPLRFNEPQPTFFAAPRAHSAAYRVGAFNGSVADGASCNCSTYSLTPHCNGTHTECVGHITADEISIREIAPHRLLLAWLATVRPKSAKETTDALNTLARDDDPVIDAQLLNHALAASPSIDALILRTLPNTLDKSFRDYDRIACAPYLTAAAAAVLVARNIEHLLIDLPSVDRAHDNGALAAHRAFWGLPSGGTDAKLATRSRATITELCFIDDAIVDGGYVLNLQIAPFVADAAPSRPLIYPLTAR